VLDLPAVLRDFASVARRVLPTTIEWRLEVPEEEMRARIDRVQVEEALLGLVVNARDAMPAGGELTVVLSSVTETGADGTAHRLARIALSDTGPGVPAADVERLWTPYFTTKAAGMGLGLSFGLAILREHGGDLRLESMPGAGATFAAYLPLVEARTPRAASPAAARPPLAQPHASRTVLFVEDEPAVRVTTARLLERSGFRVIAVEHGEEAWERFEANPRDIDALVTDLQMPRMSGAELIKRVRQHHSRLPVVVTSAFPSDDTTDRELRTPYTATLRKPFPVSTLIETLRALLVPAG
jgi:CheY-like chemotaxis protein